MTSQKPKGLVKSEATQMSTPNTHTIHKKLGNQTNMIWLSEKEKEEKKETHNYLDFSMYFLYL